MSVLRQFVSLITDATRHDITIGRAGYIRPVLFETSATRQTFLLRIIARRRCPRSRLSAESLEQNSPIYNLHLKVGKTAIRLTHIMHSRVDFSESIVLPSLDNRVRSPFPSDPPAYLPSFPFPSLPVFPPLLRHHYQRIRQCRLQALCS